MARKWISWGLAVWLAAACGPAAPAAPPTEVAALPSATPAEAASAPTRAPARAEFIAHDPATVTLAAGRPQLVEFFAFY